MGPRYIFCLKHNFSYAYFARFQGEGKLKFPGGVHYIGKFEKGKAVEVSICQQPSYKTKRTFFLRASKRSSIIPSIKEGLSKNV